jgi:hypothetical protein
MNIEVHYIEVHLYQYTYVSLPQGQETMETKYLLYCVSPNLGKLMKITD